MRPNTSTGIRNDHAFAGNFTSVKMGIDPAAMAHIMSVLTDLYKDPEMAVIREYSANARDSHIMAGCADRPIEVWTPGLIAPAFKVQDYGVGLTMEEIVQVYGQYGASNKRDSDSVTGMFGLGSKSALTYTNTFTVTAVKDGVKSQVMFARLESGEGEITELDQSETDEPDGVLVEIPVRTRNSFADKVGRFFRFWEPGTVLVNGVEPPRAAEKLVATDVTATRKINDEMVTQTIAHSIHVTDLEQSYVVMGNVAYPVNDTHYAKAKFVAYVPIGMMSITPNREELMYNPLTEGTLAGVKKAFTDALVDTAKEDIDAASDFAEAWRRKKAWIPRFEYSTLHGVGYKGKDFVGTVGRYGYNSSETPLHAMKYTPGSYRKTAEKIDYVEASSLYDGGAVVVGFKPTSLSQTWKTRMNEWNNQWVAKGNEKISRFVIMDVWPDKDARKRLTGVPFIEADDLKKIAVPKTVSNGSGPSYNLKAVPGSWERYINYYGSVQEVTSLDTTAPIVFVSGQEEVRGYRETPAALMSNMPSDVQYLRLGRNRWAKFKQQFPMAKHVKQYLEDELKSIFDKFSDDDKARIALNSHASYFTALGESGETFDDPDLVEAIRIAKLDMPDVKQFEAFKHMARLMYVKAPGVEEDKTLFERYPLMESANPSQSARHIAFYCNAVYIAEK